MKSKILLVGLLVFFLGVGITFAQSGAPADSQQLSLKNGRFAEEVAGWQFAGLDKGLTASVQVATPAQNGLAVPVKSLVLTMTPTEEAKPETFQISQTFQGSVAVGEEVTVRLLMRSAEARSVRVILYRPNPHERLATVDAALTPEWREFTATFKAVEALPAGNLRFTIHLGPGPGSLELADVRVAVQVPKP